VIHDLDVDKLSAAGSGSTANSCAVVRVHYSTLEGTAVAYESYQYWNDRATYLGEEWIDDPDDFNRNLTAQARAQAYRLDQRIPDMQIPNQIQGVVDLYDVADDWIPIYDKSDLSGYY
jgi:hypothetical protein